jgi:hypothetical protein
LNIPLYWYYSLLSDCEHVNDELVKESPIPDNWYDGPWSNLALQLSESLEMNATRKIIRTKQGHTIEYDEIKALLSKNLIDRADFALAELYGLSEDHLDYLINYDAKYRMRAGVDDE